MTSLSSFAPFLIGEGQSKTGLFTYLESWVKPIDAYDTMQNAYIYRGSLYQRQGDPRDNARGAAADDSQQPQSARGGEGDLLIPRD